MLVQQKNEQLEECEEILRKLDQELQQKKEKFDQNQQEYQVPTNEKEDLELGNSEKEKSEKTISNGK